jgi:hypothetical protein
MFSQPSQQNFFPGNSNAASFTLYPEWVEYQISLVWLRYETINTTFAEMIIDDAKKKILFCFLCSMKFGWFNSIIHE